MYFTSKRLVLVVSLVSAWMGQNVDAAIWAGGSGNWSSDVNPGWNGTGVPNAVGATASFSGGTAGTTTQDVSGLTIGTIDFSLGNVLRSFTMTNAITLDQDGAGASFATISNTNANTGSSNRLSIGAGTFTLADNLLISNSGGSTNTSASISISTTLGGTGNMTLSNVSNSLSAGMITITGSNTFTGNVAIQKGAITFAGNTGMGSAGNAVTLGSSGNGSTTLVSTGSVTNLANNITVASGTGGTLLLGSNNAGATNSTFSGTILLNGNLSITSSKTSTGIVNFSNVISGVGALTKVGTGMATLSATNTYSGTTTITAGTLALGASGSINNSTLVDMNAGATYDTTSHSFTMLSTQTFKFTLDPTATGSAGLLNSAALNITSGVVDFNGLSTLDDTAYIFANYTSLSGSAFNTISNLPAGYTINYSYLGNQIALVAVPEPSIITLMILGLVFMCARTHYSRRAGSVFTRN